MTERERLIKLIITSVDGCAEYWASRIADYLLANGVVVPVRCGECELCNDFGHEGWCKRFDTRVGQTGIAITENGGRTMELKPCPFCGGEARLGERFRPLPYYVMCEDCCAQTDYFDAAEEAIKAWNRRADNG